MQVPSGFVKHVCTTASVGEANSLPIASPGKGVAGMQVLDFQEGRGRHSVGISRWGEESRQTGELSGLR